MIFFFKRFARIFFEMKKYFVKFKKRQWKKWTNVKREKNHKNKVDKNLWTKKLIIAHLNTDYKFSSHSWMADWFVKNFVDDIGGKFIRPIHIVSFALYIAANASSLVNSNHLFRTLIVVSVIIIIIIIII